ncbi:MAG: DUF5050 domain-containing protein [Oscillospiraceae bacterium]|nr:DUF5050 domain-containing protein [Oscillospiraceae bacterium]
MPSIHDYEPLFGEWKIGKRLGKGGFGEVYSIYKEAFGITQWAAVKRIELPQSSPEKDSVLLERVKAEIMSMIQMKDYPHIVKIEDFAIVNWKRDDGQDILIRMELLTSLEEKIKDGPLPVDEIIKLGIHICKMLEVCEQHNIIHRDIKPANIFITKYGDYKLGDFGISRTLADGSASTSIGTMDFIAPEVASFRQKYDSRVDIYSLGLTMYYLLNGNRLPFEDEDSDESPVVRRIYGEGLPNIEGVSEWLFRVVSSACAYKAIERYGNAEIMRKRLVRGQDTISIYNEHGYLRFYDLYNDMLYEVKKHSLRYYKDWMYYINATTECLFRIRKDGTNKMRLTDVAVHRYRIHNDWLYYRDTVAGNMILKGRLFRIHLDGTNNTQLTEELVANYRYWGEWIFYVTGIKSSSCLYRIRLDGGDKMKLADDVISSTYHIFGDWLFYTTGKKYDYCLFKVRFDGTDRMKLVNGRVSYFWTEEKWIFYKISGNNTNLYRIRIDGSDYRVVIADGFRSILAIKDKCLYYSDYNSVYKIELDGTSKSRITDYDTESLYFLGDFIYYSVEKDNGLYKLFRVHLDGKYNEMIISDLDEHSLGYDEYDDEENPISLRFNCKSNPDVLNIIRPDGIICQINEDR